MAAHGAAVNGHPGTQVSLPVTEHVLAELGSIYPTVAYWASAEAGDEEEPFPLDSRGAGGGARRGDLRGDRRAALS